MSAARWKPSTTVAAIIEREGRFLLVEEHTPEGLRLNNPAGHLDPGESLVQACARETLEETAHHFTPRALVGVYLARVQLPDGPLRPGGDDVSYLRFAFCGEVSDFDPLRRLDRGIVATHWLTRQQLAGQAHRLRGPLVLRCIDDYLAGQRFDLSAVASVYNEDSAVQPTPLPLRSVSV